MKAPVLQQIIANRIGYLQDLPDLPKILGEMQANLQAAANAFTAADPNTLDVAHQVVYALLPLVKEYLSSLVKISDTGMQLLAFATSPLSGVLLGLIGPGLGAALVLGENLNSIGADLAAADLGNALRTLIDTPAGMTDALLNGGGTVDITGLVTTFGPLIGVEFPDGVKIDLTLGGVFSPGGSMFNALGFDFGIDLFDIPDLLTIQLVPGAAVGPIGSVKLLRDAIARAIGWDGTSNPLAAPTTAAATTTAAAEVPRSVAAALADTSAGSTAPASRGDAGEVDAVTDSGAKTPPAAPEQVGPASDEAAGDAEPQQSVSEDSDVVSDAVSAGEDGDGPKSGSDEDVKKDKLERVIREKAESASSETESKASGAKPDSKASSDAKSDPKSASDSESQSKTPTDSEPSSGSDASSD